ncbi:cyclin-dependent protein kinase inhibitor SMR2-like [Pistacia vera]|uniref:Uncharacterized protein n=1 Tax=Pistacia integerrima TaxID=434235 RepID=A0ACC0XRI5_9ROSI|nr:cyclin-dependent protein kinase inhibitor SMR2-like [Pistacia vera]KAJ0021713.1 hypothetical protein Pint_32032 [Pistacia integerrima]
MSKDHKNLLQNNNLPELKPPESSNQDDDKAAIEASEDCEDCKTPTSIEHKIPTIQSCPPTPRKKVQVSFYKRKRSEVPFFEGSGREEVESFLRSLSSELSNKVELESHAVKKIKRCWSF